MGRHIRRMGSKAWLAAGFGVWLVAIGGVRATVIEADDLGPPKEKSTTAQNPPQAGYVGEDTCLVCHSDAGEGYFGSVHHVAADLRTPAGRQGCESCHGPGEAHVSDPMDESVRPRAFSKLPPSEVNEACTSCHNRGEHALWDGSQHEARDVSCTSCHSVHAAQSEATLLKAVNQRELCASCHRDKISKLDRSGHMPVREGKIECTTCHNVHGATNVRLLRKGDSIQELCTSCHAEKRGPFLWEHAPTRDGCVTCHDPHGSSNERMLVAKPPILCQRCHIHTRHPSTIYDASVIDSARVYARSCVTCHSAIHGSNHPSGARFIR